MHTVAILEFPLRSSEADAMLIKLQFRLQLDGLDVSIVSHVPI